MSFKSRRVGGLIADVVDAPEDEAVRADVAEAVAELCAANPLYEELEAAATPGTGA